MKVNPVDQQILIFLLLSPSTARGHSHGVLSIQYLTHLVTKTVWYGPTPLLFSPYIYTPHFNGKIHIMTKEEESLWLETETQAKIIRRICKLELRSSTQQVFRTDQRFRASYRQGWSYQRWAVCLRDRLCTGCLWARNLNTAMAQTAFTVPAPE